MGGLLTRMQVTDTGMTLWDAVFTQSPDEIDLSAEDVEQLTRVLVVEPLPFVERAVFCSTPHRGSKTAANSAGKLGAALVKLPKETLDLSRRIALSAGDAFTEGAAQKKKLPDSVQTLQPENPVVVALNTLPIDSRVTYHTIVGDRGKGDTPDSSDGVVPYWSSHLDGAASEKIVPSSHGSHKREAIDQLLQTYELPVVLVGDTGQHDPEIYRALIDAYPRRVDAVLLRHVADEERENAVRTLYADIGASRLVLSSHSSGLALGAEQAGLVPAGWSERVRAAETTG